MYFGSVRFYKHLIYFVLSLIVILAIIGLITVISFFIPKDDGTKDASGTIENSSALNGNEKDPSTNTGSNTGKDATTNVGSNQGGNTSSGTTKPNDSNTNGSSTNNSDDNSEKDNSSESNPSSEDIDYKKLYPDLYAETTKGKIINEKTAYFTFNDRPSSSTEAILEVLNKNNIKATFFVITGSTNSNYLDSLNDIVKDGHSIGLYCNTKIYKELYASVDSYLKDIDTSYKAIYNATGYKPTVVRFPDGSSNDNNKAISEALTDEVIRRNFRYFDWNVSFDNQQNTQTATQLYNSVMQQIKEKDGDNLVVLSYDKANNSSTLDALDMVIKALKDKGYSFGTLDNSIAQVVFSNK